MELFLHEMIPLAKAMGVGVEVSDDEITLTVVDPKNPKSLAVFTYRNQEIRRDTGARAMIANSMRAGPGALFDLASLEPAIAGPLAALQ